MKKISALIDFTEITSVVLDFAKNLALDKNAVVALVTVIEKGNKEEKDNAQSGLKHFQSQLAEFNVKSEIEIHEGNFVDVIAGVLEKIHTDLAIIGTHGKKGIKQNLFGSNILKLVKHIQLPSLVVQYNSIWPVGGFKNILFPIAAHSRFKMKIEQTRQVMEKDGKFLVYAIYKTDILESELKKNLQLSQELFAEENLAYEMVEEDSQIYSVGYSRQTLDYASKHPVDMMSIMAQVAKNNAFFGNADKENIILNHLGIPVLCCNDDQIHH